MGQYGLHDDLSHTDDAMFVDSRRRLDLHQGWYALRLDFCCANNVLVDFRHRPDLLRPHSESYLRRLIEIVE